MTVPYDEDKKLRGAFDEVATCLEQLANSLRCNRTFEAMEAAARFSHKLHKLEKLEGQEHNATQPFNLILEKIADTISNIALENPKENVEVSIEKQRKMLMWYLEQQQPVLAATLARELLVSERLIAQNNELSNLVDKEQRENAELFLNQLRGRDSLINKNSLSAEEKNMIKVWEQLANLRNDIAHAGMRKEALKASKIIGNIDKIISTLVEEK